jgi:hypothetical protein
VLRSSGLTGTWAYCQVGRAIVRTLLVIGALASPSVLAASGCALLIGVPDLAYDPTDASIDHALIGADGALDGSRPSTSCDPLESAEVVVPGEPAPGNLATDGLHLYWTTLGSGVRRARIQDFGVIETVENVDARSIALTATYVTWMRSDHRVFAKPKSSLTTPTSTLWNYVNANSIVPHGGDDVLIVNTTAVSSCAAGGTTCPQLLTQDGLTAVAPGTAPALVYISSLPDNGVWFCPSNCRALDASAPIATAQPAPIAIAADATRVFWVDRSLGAVRRIPRSGGAVENVVTGLVEPFTLSLDDESVVVAAANGIFRVAKLSQCAVTRSGTTVATSIAVTKTSIFFVDGNVIKRVTE